MVYSTTRVLAFQIQLKCRKWFEFFFTFCNGLVFSQSTNIQLTWQVSSTGLRGDEGFFSIPIQFSVSENAKNREDISTLSNNNVTVTIPVNARATVDIMM